MERLNQIPVSKYLEGGDLVFLPSTSRFEMGGSHVTLLYYVNKHRWLGQRPDTRVCGSPGCEEDASFVLYDRDHSAMESVALSCEDHAPEEFKKRREEKMQNG